MRKLDKKNKAYIIVLSSLAAVILILLLIFIIYKIRQTNIKYIVNSGSFVYSTSEELKSITEDTYAKKNLLGKYYIVNGNDKVNIGTAPVIYNGRTREIKLLGTFYEISKNGEVNKLKGETDINSSAVNRIFKIADRKYLLISSSIRSLDGSLNAKDYLLINIDKAGNGYLYNNEINIKTFSDLSLVTDSFTFNVNEELLLIENESVDLAKINGSTNEYQKEQSDENDPESGNSTNANLPNGNNIYPVTENVITQTITENKYVAKKTTIMNLDTTTSEIKINYIVYDPFSEYKGVHVNLYQNGTLINNYNLELALTNYTISNLLANTDYRLDFYYSYEDENGIDQNILFDTAIVTTKTINANITLEKISETVVRYILKVDESYILDQGVMAFYIDGNLVATDAINPQEAASSNGYVGTITYTGSGNFAILKLTNCVYNGKSIEIDSTYKYKL